MSKVGDDQRWLSPTIGSIGTFQRFVWLYHSPPDYVERQLKSPSALLTNQIRSVSQERFLRKRGEVETATLESVLMVVRKFLTI